MLFPGAVPAPQLQCRSVVIAFGQVADCEVGDAGRSGNLDGCGNKAARTDLTVGDLDVLGGVEAVMGEITRRISFGMGVPAAERSDHAVLDCLNE